MYSQPWYQGPANINEAGGLSAFGVMGLGGNVWEWEETARDITNDSPGEDRGIRGGAWRHGANILASTYRSGSTGGVTYEKDDIGFRVASLHASSAVPEPGSVAVWTLLGVGALVWGRKPRKK